MRPQFEIESLSVRVPGGAALTPSERFGVAVRAATAQLGAFRYGIPRRRSPFGGGCGSKLANTCSVMHRTERTGTGRHVTAQGHPTIEYSFR